MENRKLIFKIKKGEKKQTKNMGGLTEKEV